MLLYAVCCIVWRRATDLGDVVDARAAIAVPRRSANYARRDCP